MAERSLTATPDGIQQINRALTARGWSRDDLVKECGCSRQPAIKFCSGKAVSNKLFVSFCNALELDWEDIAGRKAALGPDETKEPETDIDALVQTVRAQVHDDIQARCGTMRVLDMEQPIGLDDIYTNVNILEKLSSRRRLSLDELLQECDPENFDRFLLGQVRHKRVSGLEAVDRYDQLMILGKPGAGKTTFMKRLAILCNQGKFQPDRVPVFVTLKDYAEADREPKLQAYIQRQWNACGVEAADALSTILGSGKALVLLDGLDEVYETEHDRVLQDIKTFAHQFRNCQCVITCRIAAREYTFEQFTEVEVADFDKVQIAEFAFNWFFTKKDIPKAKAFIQRLEENKPIQELANNPLLLTLLCLVFEEAANFPENRADLYKEGLDVLLKKWDAKRNIYRDQIYKKLSLKRKEDLLSQLAFETFERGNYFFKQADAEQHIVNYISNIAGMSEDEEDLHLDGESILRSIEAQHGLLVERARRIYSFSHLTFQEYFSAKHITSSSINSDASLKNLATHITDSRYNEVFLLALDMLPVADGLLFHMKRNVDLVMKDLPECQNFLSWVHRKALSVTSSHNLASIRAYYFSLVTDFDPDPEFLSEYLAIFLDIDLEPDLELDLDLIRSFVSLFRHDYIDSMAALDHAIYNCFRLEENNIIDSLRAELEKIRKRFPSLSTAFEARIEVGESIAEEFAEDLRLGMEKYRDIGHSWQVDLCAGKGAESIRKYYYANKLLIQCLSANFYITKTTRHYIESTLFMPWSEIEKYPVPDAIANL